ncbi:MAG: VOC family protein [Alphaproteobacteria bacterium]|nr:VOC family protein [Alphaproteobacteria bacterium]
MSNANNNVTWFEVMGQDAAALRSFYKGLFNWDFQVIEAMNYGLTACDQTGLPGGVGATQQGQGWVTFYVQTGDIQASIDKAVALGGQALQPPHGLPDGGTVATIRDPEGHVIGLVQPAAA